jgi:hypothetical protein
VKAIKHLLFRLLLLFGIMNTLNVSAQSWMSGFNYRKSISIIKAQVSGAIGLTDFPVLISVTDADLKYLVGQCNANKISSSAGLDISFAVSSAPGNSLKFQIDTYDPITGTLTCWVNIPVLSASGGTLPNTIIYLYYGSNTLQDPLAANATATWTGLGKLWHMNLDVAPAASRNAKYNTLSEMARGTGLMNAGNFTVGKVGTAVRLNGSNESMNAARDTSTTFTISAWIKMNRLDVEQVLISNDSSGIGGYTIRISSTGKLTLDVKKSSGSTITSLIAGTTLSINQWYHIAISRDGKAKNIYINGKIATGVTRTEGVGVGGAVSIGRGKLNDRYFSGMIDELRISNEVKTLDWLKTEYNNQNDPTAFYVVGAEERNPVFTWTGYLFTAALNDNWSEPGNWNLNRVPEPYANVIVKASGKLSLRDAAQTQINQLTLLDGASLIVQNTKFLVCKMQLNDNASMLISGSLGLQFNGDVLNNGVITTGETQGTITFSGNQPLTALSGTGNMRVFHVQINQGGTSNQINLNQPVIVTGKLELKAGILNTNGKLTLSATKTQVASLLPITNLSNASIIGNVVVERYVSGTFPTPATARGWRLWSSPVYAGGLNVPEYDLTAFKNAVFVTGKGGAVNGFDDSPQNGNTIFTHDQSIGGSLSQKYIPIPNLSVRVSLGTGIYVYSRGGRDVADALKNQVLSPPFLNPEPYTIRYTGSLFTGDLKVLLNSRNRKEPGDGFNLLGNPYASPIRWGSLIKENTTAFVWTFNPLNNSYDVSDDPDFTIPIGSGFFVKVIEGVSTGSVTFREDAKLPGSVVPLASGLSGSAARTAGGVATTARAAPATTIATLTRALGATTRGTLASTISIIAQAAENVHRKLEAVISRGPFNQKYILKLEPAGSDEITDADAPSLGEGFVNIAGLSVDNQKLMIDSRALTGREAVVPLYVKGWSSGMYDLDFSGLDSFLPEDSVMLIDKYLNYSRLLSRRDHSYTFQIDVEAAQSQGLDRFSLVIRSGRPHPLASPNQLGSEAIRLYPNPFTEVITITSLVSFPAEMQITIRNLMGQVVLTKNINTMEESTSLTVNAASLVKGFYIIELRDRKLNKRLKTAKIIKL